MKRLYCQPLTKEETSAPLPIIRSGLQDECGTGVPNNTYHMSNETRPPMTHELKCHPEPFQAVKRWEKNFEFRKDDRDYRVGDTLRLMEWDPILEIEGLEGVYEEPAPKGYTGDECQRTVTYIIREGFGIPEGYCIMALAGQQDKQPSPSVLPVFTEEEIERMAMDICPGETSQVMKATHPTHTILSQGANIREHIKFTLRYANTKAVSVDRITEVVENEFPVSDKYPYNDLIVNPADLRTRITSLFNGEEE